jgi:short-subunit dehydrogenase
MNGMSWSAVCLVTALSSVLYWLLSGYYPTTETVHESFKGKKVVVTGASQGIGKSLVLELARNEAHVVMISRSTTKLEAARTEVLSQFPGAQLEILPADLSSKAACLKAVDKALALLGGGIDTLILNHITSSRFGTWLEDNADHNTDEGQDFLEPLFAANTFSYIWMATAAMPALQRSNLGGRLGVVTSLAGHIGTPKTAAYSASKHALHGFFDALRLELQLLPPPPTVPQVPRINPNPSITLCSIGATDTEGASEVKHKLSASLQWDPPDWAAKSILRGIASRKREIFHPHHLVFPAIVMNLIAPDLLDYILLDTMR